MELIDFKNYSGDFEWDYKLHFPIPTESYILNRTGEDLGELFDSSPRVKGFIVGVVRTARNYMFKDKVYGQRQIIEYLIAHNEEYLWAVMEYLVEFIQIAITSGEYDNLFMLQDNKRSIKALENAYDMLPFVSNVYLTRPTKFYEGY